MPLLLRVKASVLCPLLFSSCLVPPSTQQFVNFVSTRLRMLFSRRRWSLTSSSCRKHSLKRVPLTRPPKSASAPCSSTTAGCFPVLAIVRFVLATPPPTLTSPVCDQWPAGSAPTVFLILRFTSPFCP